MTSGQHARHKCQAAFLFLVIFAVPLSANSAADQSPAAPASSSVVIRLKSFGTTEGTIAMSSQIGEDRRPMRTIMRTIFASVDDGVSAHLTAVGAPPEAQKQLKGAMRAQSVYNAREELLFAQLGTTLEQVEVAQVQANANPPSRATPSKGQFVDPFFDYPCGRAPIISWYYVGTKIFVRVNHVTVQYFGYNADGGSYFAVGHYAIYAWSKVHGKPNNRTLYTDVVTSNTPILDAAKSIVGGIVTTGASRPDEEKPGLDAILETDKCRTYDAEGAATN